MAAADETSQDAEAGADGEAAGGGVTRKVTLDEAISMAILFLQEEQPAGQPAVAVATAQPGPPGRAPARAATATTAQEEAAEEEAAEIRAELAKADNVLPFKLVG